MAKSSCAVILTTAPALTWMGVRVSLVAHRPTHRRTTSLVAWWLRIHLAMQGTQVRFQLSPSSANTELAPQGRSCVPQSRPDAAKNKQTKRNHTGVTLWRASEKQRNMQKRERGKCGGTVPVAVRFQATLTRICKVHSMLLRASEDFHDSAMFLAQSQF